MKKLIYWVLLIFPLIFIGAFAADPGSEGDPLISKSYIDSVLMPQIMQYINEAGGTDTFSVVSVEKGMTLVGEAGCEMILRSGSGTIIATQKGGIADVTSGIDLQTNEKAPSNHLLIVHLSDGRGIYAESDMLVMVKGKYTIK